MVLRAVDGAAEGWVPTRKMILKFPDARNIHVFSMYGIFTDLFHNRDICTNHRSQTIAVLKIGIPTDMTPDTQPASRVGF